MATRVSLDYIQACRKSKLGRGAVSCGLAAAVGALLLACAGPRLHTLAGPTQPENMLAQDGVQLTLRPGDWSAIPNELSDYATPVRVRIENTRADEVSVRWEDFALPDEARTQYRTLPPAEVAQIIGSRWAAAPVVAPMWPAHYWGRPYWSAPSWGPYWSEDFGAYRYASWAAQDVLMQGLREGRILPAASIEGYLYFQRATAIGSLLTFTWTSRLAAGAPLSTLATEIRTDR